MHDGIPLNLNLLLAIYFTRVIRSLRASRRADPLACIDFHGWGAGRLFRLSGPPSSSEAEDGEEGEEGEEEDRADDDPGDCSAA
jgi:hypothetical protein